MSDVLQGLHRLPLEESLLPTERDWGHRFQKEHFQNLQHWEMAGTSCGLILVTACVAAT